MGLIVALAVVIATGNAASAVAESTCLRATMAAPLGCPPRLDVNLGVAVVPRKLFRNEATPVGFRIKGGTSYEAGFQPQTLKEAIFDVDQTLTLDVTGIPACPRRRLEAGGPNAAGRACADSVVGTGVAHIVIDSSGLGPVRIPLTVYNGGTRDGETTLFVGSIVNTPTRESTVAKVRIATRFRGALGLHAVARFPVIADGQGSLIDFDLKIERILEARCPKGELKVDFPKVLFRNEAAVPGLGARTLLKGGAAAPCTPKG